jgi:hypothetical protein
LVVVSTEICIPLPGQKAGDLAALMKKRKYLYTLSVYLLVHSNVKLLLYPVGLYGFGG